MKVLLINGSPKDKGNTFLALSKVAKTLKEEGIETEIVSIGKMAVQGCIACGMCGRTDKCTFNDDLYYKIWRIVKDGIDGLVIGSPVYYKALASDSPTAPSSAPANTTPTAIPSGRLWIVTASANMVVRDR